MNHLPHYKPNKAVHTHDTTARAIDRNSADECDNLDCCSLLVTARMRAVRLNADQFQMHLDVEGIDGYTVQWIVHAATLESILTLKAEEA